MPETDSASRAAESAALRRRAMKLAQTKAEAADDDSLHVLVFELGGTHYAVESAHIDEVLPLRDITRVPGVPPFVLGVVNIHGRILSLLDLKALFDVGRSAPDASRRWAVVLRHGDMSFCLYADSLGGIRRVPASAVFAEVASVSARRQRYVSGITADRVVVLSAPAMLTDRELIVDDRAE